METTGLMEDQEIETEAEVKIEEMIDSAEDQKEGHLRCMMSHVTNAGKNAKYHLSQEEINLCFAVIALEKMTGLKAEIIAKQAQALNN